MLFITDIKPYLPAYDSIPSAKVPAWTFQNAHPVGTVSFTSQAEKQLIQYESKLEHFESAQELRVAIEEVLRTDPRPPRHVKKTKGTGDGNDSYLYGFMIDKLNVCCEFDADNNVTVQEIEYWPVGKKSTTKAAARS